MSVAVPCCGSWARSIPKTRGRRWRMARGPERRPPSTAEEAAPPRRSRRKRERMSAGESAAGKGKYYMISGGAQNYGIHPQTLRLYERGGLLKPPRPEGNTRLYSEEDLRQLE